MNRLASFQSHSFDVVVIGGGIIGCGVARDAARRGLSVVLFEQHDFGSGTTSASTRIVHGGLRYLETADFRLVRMDLRERETLLRIAPHLVQPLEFAIPFADLGSWMRLKLRVGLALYDALAAGSSLPRHRTSGTEATYYDARIDSPERLCIENLIDAARHGAVAVNYAQVTGAVREGAAVRGVRVRDHLTGEEAAVRGRIVVNASGPWFERAAGMVGGAAAGQIRTTKGIHLVVPNVTDRALVIFSKVDGRLMFAIPRLGHTWLGTTDTDYNGDPADVAATGADVEYVLASMRGVFPNLCVDDVLYTTAGVRALVMQAGSASSVSRLHRIDDGTGKGTPGVVSILGAKITGYRAIAEDATDVVCRLLRHEAPCTTAREPLPGAGARAAAPWPHLHAVYGSRAIEVAHLAQERPDLARRLAPRYPDIAAQVVFSARHEYCMTVSDFIRRRSLLGASADQGWDAAPQVAAVLARELGWSAERQDRELEAYRRDIQKTLSFRAADARSHQHVGAGH
jgi:glycerol-3-phosphate dehydrogenase